MEKTDKENPENAPDVEAALRELRKKIDAIDETIVSLLAKRQEVVRRVVDFKKAHGLPVYHPAREEDLISRRRRQGEDSGLNPDFIEDLYRSVIRASRVVQASSMAARSVRPGATVLIVGGRGRMGRYFAKWFADAGYAVRTLDQDDWAAAGELCAGADLVMLSVPIDQTCAAAGRIAPHLSGDAVLTDITSIKEPPMAAMTAAHPGPVIGLHPLFGPTTSTLDQQIIVATPGRDADACRWVTDQFMSWGCIIIEAEAREHDEIMDIVQALRHFATFTFGRFLADRNVNLGRTLEFSSPIYRLELGMVGRLFAQDPSLYCEIIFASAGRRELLKQYISSMNRNLEMIETEDKALFHREFGKIAAWFGPFSDQAMRESTYLINKLIERF